MQLVKMSQLEGQVVKYAVLKPENLKLVHIGGKIRIRLCFPRGMSMDFPKVS